MAPAIFEVLLFLWLQPGVVFTVPPIDGKWFSTDTMSWKAVLVHAAIFAGFLYLLRLRGFVAEGFQDAPKPTEEQRVAISGNRRRIEERMAELKYFNAL